MTDPAKPKAVACGKLHFGSIEVDCYVLDDGCRVLSQRGIVGSIGVSKSTTLARVISRLPSRFANLALSPEVAFDLPNGGTAIGRDRMFFVQLCDAYAESWAAGELHSAQEIAAKVALAIIRALAKVGIDALIDEATGYQSVRENDYLQRLFAHSLRTEANRWELTFPDSVARALAPLWGAVYVSGSHPKELHWAYGQIYDLVLGEDVAREMRKRNRNTKNSMNHHQWLQENARGLLADDLRMVEMLASQSGTKAEFWARMRAHYRKEPLQLGFAMCGGKR